MADDDLLGERSRGWKLLLITGRVCGDDGGCGHCSVLMAWADDGR